MDTSEWRNWTKEIIRLNDTPGGESLIQFV